MVEQVSFIAGTRSVNEKDLRKNLKFFKVPEDNIESIKTSHEDIRRILLDVCTDLDLTGAHQGQGIQQ